MKLANYAKYNKENVYMYVEPNVSSTYIIKLVEVFKIQGVNVDDGRGIEGEGPNFVIGYEEIVGLNGEVIEVEVEEKRRLLVFVV